jgi:RNA-directed DNA polymerase
MMDPSVWKVHPALAPDKLPEPGCSVRVDWVHPSWVRSLRYPTLGGACAARGEVVHLKHHGVLHLNVGTSLRAPGYGDAGQAPMSGDVSKEGRSLRSSPSTEKPCAWRREAVGKASKPRGKAMYVASKLDRAWLLNEQRKLYQRSYKEAAYVHRKLWGLVTDPRNLRIAFAVVARNKGKRTPGVDGVTVGSVLRDGLDAFLDRIRVQLRTGAYGPSPVRRVLIPKRGKPGQTRPLGIPTITDRVVQAAMKNILEPVFEADFYPVSFGVRPGKSAHGALEYLRIFLRPREAGPEAKRRLTYQWAVEGDIKACFDNIDHHGLMNRVRRRVADPKVNRLLVAFLKAGVYTKEQVLWSDAGTPQGGILSPLLANIALSVIEERYERHVWPRHRPTTLTDPAATTIRANANRRYDRQCGRSVCVPIRYADDFIVLVGAAPGPSQQSEAEAIANQEKEWKP